MTGIEPGENDCIGTQPVIRVLPARQWTSYQL